MKRISALFLNKVRKHKYRYLMLLLGIGLSISLVVSIDLSIKELEINYTAESLKDCEIDFIVSFNNKTDTTISSIHEKIEQDYPEYQYYDGFSENYPYCYLNSSPTFNFSYFENTPNNISLFRDFQFCGIQEDALYSSIFNESFKLYDVNETINDRYIFIEEKSALEWGLSIGESVSIGSYEINSNDPNVSRSFENIKVKGFFSIENDDKFAHFVEGEYQFNEYTDLRILTSMDFGLNLFNNLSKYPMDQFHMGLSSNHSHLYDLSPTEIRNYVYDFQSDFYNDIDGQVSVRAPLENYIFDLSRLMGSITFISRMTQIPIILLCLIMIRYGLKYILMQDFSLYNVLRMRGGKKKQVDNLIKLEILSIGLISPGFGMLLSYISYKIISPMLKSKIDIVFSQEINVYNYISPSYFITLFILMFSFIYYIGYREKKKILNTKSLLNENYEENIEFHSIKKYKKKLQVALLIFFTLIIIFKIIQFKMGLGYNDENVNSFVMFMIIIDNTFGLIFPLIPFVIFYLLGKYIVPFVQVKSRSLIVKIRKRTRDDTKSFLMEKIQILNPDSQNEKIQGVRPLMLMILIIISLGFSMMVGQSMINQQEYSELKYINSLGGDSYIHVKDNDLDFNNSEISQWKNMLVENSSLNVEKINILHDYKDTLKILPSYTYSSNDFREKDIELIGLNLSDYFNHYSLNLDKDNFLGEEPEMIEQKLKENRCLILSKSYQDQFNVEEDNEIVLNYIYSNGTGDQYIEITYKIVGFYDLLPGVKESDDWDSNFIGIIDQDQGVQYNGTRLHFASCSFIIDYDFSDTEEGSLESRKEEFELISSSESFLFDDLYLNSIYSHYSISRPYDGLIESYFLKTEPLLWILYLERIFLLVISCLSILLFTFLIVHFRRERILGLRIHGVKNFQIKSLLFSEVFINLCIMGLFSLLTLLFSRFQDYYILQHYFNEDNIGYIRAFRFSLTLILSNYLIYAGVFLVVVYLAYRYLIKSISLSQFNKFLKTKKE